MTVDLQVSCSHRGSGSRDLYWVAKKKVNNGGVAAEISRIMNGSGILDVLSKSQGFLFQGWTMSRFKLTRRDRKRSETTHSP